jgi:membrane-associated protease RseP (regulator of RpoE activity)
MESPAYYQQRDEYFQQSNEAFKKKDKLWLHALLFVATCVSCIVAGTVWAAKDPLDVSNWQYGITYAVLIVSFLTAHEFGHYFAARYHKVEATLPFYIPMPLLFAPFFGTLGAVIRTRSAIPNRKVLFDIGVSGPIAGFVMCLLFLIIGFMTLPGKEYLYSIHPEYLSQGGQIPTFGLLFGDTLLYHFLEAVFAKPFAFIPPMNEMYHYPFLCVGWFGLFVTSLNLLPMGQLDGGHITYAMFGAKVQGIIARVLWVLMIIIGGGAFYEMAFRYFHIDRPEQLYTFLQTVLLPVLYFLKTYVPWLFLGWSGWLLWALIIKFFVKFDHPPVEDNAPLDTKRMVIGWLAILIFVVSFCYNGIYEGETKLTREQQRQNQQMYSV